MCIHEYNTENCPDYRPTEHRWLSQLLLHKGPILLSTLIGERTAITLTIGRQSIGSSFDYQKKEHP